jgi:hypothetical protein
VVRRLGHESHGRKSQSGKGEGSCEGVDEVSMKSKTFIINAISTIAAFLITISLFFITSLLVYFCFIFLIVLIISCPIFISMASSDEKPTRLQENYFAILAIIITPVITISSYKIPYIAQQNNILKNLSKEVALNCEVADSLDELTANSSTLALQIPTFRFETEYFKNNLNTLSVPFNNKYNFDLINYVKILESENKLLDHINDIDIYKNPTADTGPPLAKIVIGAINIVKKEMYTEYLYTCYIANQKQSIFNDTNTDDTRKSIETLDPKSNFDLQ